MNVCNIVFILSFMYKEVICQHCFFGGTSGKGNSWRWSLTPIGKDSWCKCTSLHLGGHNVDGYQSSGSKDLLTEIQRSSVCNETGTSSSVTQRTTTKTANTATGSSHKSTEGTILGTNKQATTSSTTTTNLQPSTPGTTSSTSSYTTEASVAATTQSTTVGKTTSTLNVEMSTDTPISAATTARTTSVNSIASATTARTTSVNSIASATTARTTSASSIASATTARTTSASNMASATTARTTSASSTVFATTERITPEISSTSSTAITAANTVITTTPPTTTSQTSLLPSTNAVSTTPEPTPLSTDDQFDAQGAKCQILQAHQSFDSCSAVYDAGFTTSGVYIMSLSSTNIRMYCNISDIGVWMVVQRRINGLTDFYRNWYNYTNGFGNLCEEFYWGNQNLMSLLSDPWNLRIELVSYEPILNSILFNDQSDGEVSSYREYGNFQIDKKDYHMQVDDAGTGTADDGLYELKDDHFSTYDDDNDGDGNNNLAELYHTGWWFRKELSTPKSNLNGKYYQKEDTRDAWQGIIWVTDKLVIKSKMMIKPR